MKANLVVALFAVCLTIGLVRSELDSNDGTTSTRRKSRIIPGKLPTWDEQCRVFSSQLGLDLVPLKTEEKNCKELWCAKYNENGEVEFARRAPEPPQPNTKCGVNMECVKGECRRS